MSEEKKDEVLEQEKELDEKELDAVAGGGACVCVYSGSGIADPVPRGCSFAGCDCPVMGYGD